jgi:hypothetical protein
MDGPVLQWAQGVEGLLELVKSGNTNISVPATSRSQTSDMANNQVSRIMPGSVRL